MSENKEKKKTFFDNHPIISVLIWSIIIIPIFISFNNSVQNEWNNSSIPDWIESQFSWFDGSHIYLKEYLKKNLKDPGSIEIIDTRYVDTKDLNWDDYLIVNMKYRAKNSFWWYVVETINAQFDKNWNPINIDKWETY